MNAPTTTVAPSWTPQFLQSLYEFLDEWVTVLEEDATARRPRFPFHPTPQTTTFHWVDSPPSSQTSSESPPQLILPVPQSFELLLESGQVRRDTRAIFWRISLGETALAVFEIPHSIWHHLQRPFVPSPELVLEALHLSVSLDGAPIGLQAQPDIITEGVPIAGTTTDFRFQPIERFDFITLQDGSVVKRATARLLLKCANPGCAVLLPWEVQPKWCAAHLPNAPAHWFG